MGLAGEVNSSSCSTAEAGGPKHRRELRLVYRPTLSLGGLDAPGMEPKVLMESFNSMGMVERPGMWKHAFIIDFVLLSLDFFIQLHFPGKTLVELEGWDRS